MSDLEDDFMAGVLGKILFIVALQSVEGLTNLFFRQDFSLI